MSNNLERYRNTWYYQNLLKQHSLDEVGVWKVRGEDANCDLGGSHYMPDLGTYEGRLDDIIAMAVDLPSFWQWGGGGEISAVTVKRVDPNTNAKRAQLRQEIADLEAKLTSAKSELNSL